MAKKKSTSKDTSKEETLSSEQKTSNIVYVGMANGASRKGKSGKTYKFTRDRHGDPKPVEVNDEDVQALLDETGKACAECRHKVPTALFLLQTEYDELCKNLKLDE